MEWVVLRFLKHRITGMPCGGLPVGGQQVGQGIIVDIGVIIDTGSIKQW
jgi:hypothetical protein